MFPGPHEKTTTTTSDQILLLWLVATGTVLDTLLGIFYRVYASLDQVPIPQHNSSLLETKQKL